jgi:predicted nucleic acid-binding protein
MDRHVLVDTGAWLAAFDKKDQYHAAAAAELTRLRGARTPLVVTDLVVAETHLRLLLALGVGHSLASLKAIKSDPLIEEVFVDADLQRSALTDWIQRFEDQAFSFTDAVSFAVMKDRGIGAAFTFDTHFKVAGFKTLPE